MDSIASQHPASVTSITFHLRTPFRRSPLAEFPVFIPYIWATCLPSHQSEAPHTDHVWAVQGP